MVGSLGVGLSPIFQKFKPIVSILTKFSNSKTFKPSLKMGSGSIGPLTFPKVGNFIGTKFYKLKTNHLVLTFNLLLDFSKHFNVLSLKIKS